MAPRSTKTESQVQAREQLDERESQGAPDQLEDTAKEQEKQQAQELREGAKAKAGVHQKHIDNDNVAAARVSAGFNGEGAQGGLVDNMSRRSAEDALEGHFVHIDLNHKGVKDAYKNTMGLEDHKGDYAVYLEPTELDDNGYPVTALVRLRDETNARVAVPYEALRPAEAGGR